MRFTPETINVLQVFSKIYNSIIINPGNKLAIIKDTKAVYATAELNQEIDGKMPIYDLSRFLSTLALFQETPDIEIKEKKAIISSSDGKEVSYSFAFEDLIPALPSKEINFPTPDVAFTISSQEIVSIMKAQSVLKLKELAIVGDGKKITIKTFDSKNSSADSFSLDIGKTNKKFTAIFLPDNLTLMNDDYAVEISSKGLSSWKGKTVHYYIALEAHSTFN